MLCYVMLMKDYKKRNSFVRSFFFYLFRETFTIFTGGLSMEKGGKSPCITVLQGKSTTVLEMEHPVVDFVTICESPWASGGYILFIYLSEAGKL